MVTFAELQTQARPMRWYIKLLSAVLALVFFAVLATLAIAGFLVYRIVKPQRASTEINMQSFPGRPDAIQFSVAGNPSTREGWFFPGFRGASTIILCHGYGSSKGELLTLVSALQDHQYNVFVFDFAAHGANDGITSFGYHEADEVRSAIDAVAQRNDVNPLSFGLWGYNLGAYAALREAETDKRVHALVLDSVYDLPEQMVRVGVERQGLGGFPLMIKSAEFSFQWLNHQYRGGFRFRTPSAWRLSLGCKNCSSKPPTNPNSVMLPARFTSRRRTLKIMRQFRTEISPAWMMKISVRMKIAS